MNIKVAAFTVSIKSIYIQSLLFFFTFQLSDVYRNTNVTIGIDNNVWVLMEGNLSHIKLLLVECCMLQYIHQLGFNSKL